MRTRERRLHQQARLEQEKIRFQFETLRNQVNPHFLFNSFNTLVSIIEDEPRAAVSYVNHLSDLFRNMLAYREKTLISLKEELALLETYVFLQQQRYGENLRLEIDLSPELMASLLPPLSLQMLIENAIKHNVISRRRPLTIRMFARGDQSLVIHNPLQQKRQAAPSTKLGLENIRKRYQLLGAGEVQVIHTESYFEVVVPLVSSV
jgi:LytS/YehU family sensor histidine kinase